MQPYSLGFETNRQDPKIGVVYAAFVGRMKGLYTGPPRRFRELVVYAKYTFAGKTALKYTFAYISHVDKHALCYNEPRAEMV